MEHREGIYDELIDGETILLYPAHLVNHSVIRVNIHAIFEDYRKANQIKAFLGRADVYLSEKNRFFPDFIIVLNKSNVDNEGVHGAPDLVVEVLSATTIRYDRGAKMQAYEQARVMEYWIVSAIDKVVEQYLLKDGRFVLQNVYAYLPDHMLEAMAAEERVRLLMKFRCSLFEDLEIKVDEIFENTF